MGNQDKLENAADEKVGEAKEALGKAKDDEDLESRGQGRPEQGQPQAGRRKGEGRLPLTDAYD